jgi:DNA repair protein RadC
MKLQYFLNCKTINEAKQLYKTLALKHHPDRGGDNRTMQLINDEYAFFIKHFSNFKEDVSSDEQFKQKNEAFIYSEILNKIINYNLTIELIGNWLWLSGNTYQYRKELKEQGFLFAPKKSMWFFRFDEYKSLNRTPLDIESIRAKHGSQLLKYAPAANLLHSGAKEPVSSYMEKISLKKEKSDFKRSKIGDSFSAFETIKQFYFDDLEIFESFFILLLNRSNTTIGYAKISQGGVAGTSVDPKLIAKYALEGLASSVILAHNHPSGNLLPSEQDKGLTKKLKDGLELLDITVMDHLILSKDAYYSFADENLI